MLNNKLLEKIETHSGTNRDQGVCTWNGEFVDEVDFDGKEIVVGGDWIPMSDMDEIEFDFYNFDVLDIEMDDVFEYVKYLKKVEKSINSWGQPEVKKFTMLMANQEFVCSEESLESFKSIQEISELHEEPEIWILKRKK